MRTIIIAVLITLLPVAAFGGDPLPTIGVFFSDSDHSTVPGQQHYYPQAGVPFYGYIYVHKWKCFLQGVEFNVDYNPSIVYGSFTYPQGYLVMGNPGDPEVCVSIVKQQHPILDWPIDYLWIMTLKLYIFSECTVNGGGLANLDVIITDCEESGGTWKVCWEDGEITDRMPVIGTTAIVCPDQIATDTKSWGAIKSLYK